MPAFLTVKFVLAVIAGAAGGFAWYKIIGCSTGACPITANPWTSTAYGAVLAGLIAHQF